MVAIFDAIVVGNRWRDWVIEGGVEARSGEVLDGGAYLVVVRWLTLSPNEKDVESRDGSVGAHVIPQEGYIGRSDIPETATAKYKMA